jgi:hypothetical protein
MNKERVRYNLILGPYEFIQDQWDFGKYHIPGGAVVTEDWLRQLATNSNFGNLKKAPVPASDGRADNEALRESNWEADTLKLWRDHNARNKPTKG